MAFKTFAPGVLTSSDVNTFLMRQAVITCTSSTRPSSPSEGMTIYETDTDLTLNYSGSAWEIVAHAGAWVSYSPSFYNGYTGTDWTFGDMTISAEYQRVGRQVTVSFWIVVGSTTVAGTKSLGFTLPVLAVTQATGALSCGTCSCIDASTGVTYPGAVHREATSNNLVYPTSIGTGGSYGTHVNVRSGYPFTWASGDYIKGTFTYEAAS